MSIRHAILGFLGWKPFTGYDLKKRFADALSFHWSGNSNQIYGALLELERDGAVLARISSPDRLPVRKEYTITGRGTDLLREWLLAEPELPILRSDMHGRLAWSQHLTDAELDAVLAAYLRLLDGQIIMYRERIRRGADNPARTAREGLIWESLESHALSLYEREAEWIGALRAKLPQGGAS